MMRNEDLKCPYCEAWQVHYSEQSEENQLHQTECQDCRKIFVFEVEYYPKFFTRKADCLNGAEHRYEDRIAGDDYYQQFLSKWIECLDCGHTVRVSKPKEAMR